MEEIEQKSESKNEDKSDTEKDDNDDDNDDDEEEVELISEEEEKQLKETFRKLDNHKTGFISLDEVLILMKNIT